MLYFVVPLKSSQVSKSWDLVCKLLERTLRSICNQTSSVYHVIVVCHEKPKVEFSSPYITYVQVDIPLPNEEYSSKEKDKMLKMQIGLIKAKEANATHVMFVDADDCISNKLASFVSQNSNENGWYFSQGYDYQEDLKILRIRNSNLHLRTNSSHIIKISILTPELNLTSSDIKRGNCVLYHIDTASLLSNRGTPLKPLPFRGVIYITDNGENMWWSQDSLDKDKISFKKKILVIPKFIYQLFIKRSVSQKISDEFMLYDITD